MCNVSYCNGMCHTIFYSVMLKGPKPPKSLLCFYLPSASSFPITRVPLSSLILPLRRASLPAPQAVSFHLITRSFFLCSAGPQGSSA